MSVSEPNAAKGGRHGDRRSKIVTLATAWGYRSGGINSFNVDFMRALGRVARSYSVICVVPSASAEEIVSAKDADVTLLGLGRVGDKFSLSLVPAIADLVKKNGGDGPVVWWLGHDIVTGNEVLQLRKHTGSGQCALIMHMSYADYSNVKHLGPERGQEKNERQARFFAAADFLFAVGPLLRDRLQDLVPGKHVQMLVPGLENFEPKHSGSRLSAIAFGRLDLLNDRVKQGRLALAAFAEAIAYANKVAGLTGPLCENPTLKVLGMSDDPEHKKSILKFVEKRARRAVDVKILPYVEDRSRLRAEIDGSNLSLFLSWHEGFGLAAWEAIAAGIPLILSRRTGVYKLLDEIGGAATGCVTSVDIRGSYGFEGSENYQRQDVNSVRDAIVEVSSKLGRRIQDADSLRRLLSSQKNYTWESMASNFASALALQVESEVQPERASLSKEVRERVNRMVDLFDSGKFRDAINVADVLLRTGRYESALAELNDLDMSGATAGEAADYNLLSAEILLRLNEYDRAAKLANRVGEYFSRVGAWDKRLRAYSVVNTLFRDRGDYEKAIEVATEMLNIALKGAPSEVGAAKRKLARSLALDGQWSAAVEHATEALEIARDRQNVIDQAKSHLALAEAHRHGYLQVEAIEQYRDAINCASIDGDWDCYLWSALGLADSYFLISKHDDARAVLGPVGRLLRQKGRRFPIETLHYELSLLALDAAENDLQPNLLLDVRHQYKVLGVLWVESYINDLLSGSTIVVPRRM